MKASKLSEYSGSFFVSVTHAEIRVAGRISHRFGHGGMSAYRVTDTGPAKPQPSNRTVWAALRVTLPKASHGGVCNTDL